MTTDRRAFVHAPETPAEAPPAPNPATTIVGPETPPEPRPAGQEATTFGRHPPETDEEREARWARENRMLLEGAQALARRIEAARGAEPRRARVGSRYADRCAAGIMGR